MAMMAIPSSVQQRPGRKNSQEYLPTLNGWRAVAVLAVLMCHTAEYFFSATGLYPSPRLYAYMFHGRAGVSVFFALSGFLICTLLINEYESSGTISLRGFYVRRAFRILPPYWSYLAVILMLGLLVKLPITRIDLASSLVFVRNYARTGTWFTSHFWTLAIEEHFYLLLPGIVLLGRGRRSLTIILTLAVVTTALRYRLDQIPEGTRAIKWDGETPINELFTGALAAVLVQSSGVRSWICRLPFWSWCGVGISTIWSELGPIHLLHALQPVMLCFLIVTTALRPQTWAGRILEWRPLHSIGMVSYGLYVWQQLFLVRGYRSSDLPFGPLQRWPVSWGIIAAVAVVSFIFLERPLIRFGRRLAHYLSASGPP